MSPRQRILVTLALLAALLLLFRLSGWHDRFDQAQLRDTLMQHPVSGLLVFTLLFCGANLVQIPGLVFLVAAVLALGRVGGGLVTYVAACTACMSTFAVVRMVGGQALGQLDNRLARRLLGRLQKHPLRSVVLLRMLFQTLPAINAALALSSVSWRHYLLGTLLGLPLPLALFCLLFDYLVQLLHIV